MRRLAAIDWLLLGSTLPVILFGLVMTLVSAVRGDFVIAPFLASSAPDAQSYPVVERILPSTEENPLAVGDRLVRLEGTDLRGAPNFTVIRSWAQAARAGVRALRVTIERGGVRSDVQVVFTPGNNFISVEPQWWAALPFIVGDVVTALILLVRAAHWHLARRNYVVSMLVAFFAMPYFTVPTSLPCEIIGSMLLVLANGLLLWNLNEFVPGVHLWGWGQRALAWALGLLWAGTHALMFWGPNAGLWALSAEGLVGLGFSVASLVALARVYRRADLPQRRQIKWVVYGFVVALSAGGLQGATMAAAPAWVSLSMTVAYVAALGGPLGFLMAIAYSQFLDIDRLFSATLSFSVLAIVGVAMMLGVMPAAARAASDVLGLDPTIGQLLMSLGLAAVLVPGYRIVRPWIDRWLFPERATLQQGFEQLLADISSTADAPALPQLVSDRLDVLLRPTVVVLYVLAGDLFMPEVARGRSTPPTFAARSALVAALQERTTPLAAQRWTARRAASLTPFERAAIETLDAAVLVPIRRGDELAAFWCLGPKRSGDIYTPTDLALLGAAAGTLAHRLPVRGQTQTTVHRVTETPRTLLPEASNASTGLSTGATPNLLSKEGHFWTIDYGGVVVRLKDTKGLQYLGHLLCHPQQEFHALDLMMQVSGAGADPPLSDNGDLGPVLDAQAKADYRLRLGALRDELQEAEANNDSLRAARARAEIDMLSDQLAAAVGLGGRDRVTGSAAERARSTVTKGIKAAISAIRAAHPAAGRYLARTVRTGYFCTYEPEPDDRTTLVV